MSTVAPEAPEASRARRARRGKRGTGEPFASKATSWSVLAASFALSFSTWVALATMAGFEANAHVPYTPITVHLSWCMPIAVDGYVVTALLLWMAPVPPAVASMAQKNTYAAAISGVITQAAYHAMSTWAATHALGLALLAIVLGAAAPALSAGAIHMRAVMRRASEATAREDAERDALAEYEALRRQAELTRHAQPVALPPAPVPPVAPTVATATPAPASPKPRAATKPAAATKAGDEGTDELAARREEHAYRALVEWWQSEAGQATIASRRGNDGFPNRAEARAACRVGPDRADRLIARIRAEHVSIEDTSEVDA